MTEIFLVLLLLDGGKVLQFDKMLDACQAAKDKQAYVYDLKLGENPTIQKLKCRWADATKAHWESDVEPVATPIDCSKINCQSWILQ